MRLSEIGTIANECWSQIPNHFPFVKLGEYIVMPDHVHGIIIIDKPINDNDKNVETRLIASLPSTMPPSSTVSPSLIAPPPNDHKPGGFAGNKNPMLNENVSRIIRWYKGRTTFESRKTHADFAWQSRFHDHIIRDENSFHNISNYIANNPLNWNSDKDVIHDVSSFLTTEK
jgi:REP element-mobilizing transposase RayT